MQIIYDDGSKWQAIAGTFVLSIFPSGKSWQLNMFDTILKKSYDSYFLTREGAIKKAKHGD